MFITNIHHNHLTYKIANNKNYDIFGYYPAYQKNATTIGKHWRKSSFKEIFQFQKSIYIRLYYSLINHESIDIIFSIAKRLFLVY